MIKKILCNNGTHKLTKIPYNRLVIVAFGSNMGDRVRNIMYAIHKVPLINKIYASFYETAALLPIKNYASWDRKYLNTVLCGYCHLTPLELLSYIKRIESFLGRKKNIKWSPRPIDVDIIFYKGLKINNSKLTIPHKEAKNRNFVLYPLQELLGEYVYLVKNSL